jgi:hypothetical protein
MFYVEVRMSARIELDVLPSLPSALPYHVAVAGCHSGSTTLCAFPASAEPKKRAAQAMRKASSAAWMENAVEELELAAMLALYGRRASLAAAHLS